MKKRSLVTLFKLGIIMSIEKKAPNEQGNFVSYSEDARRSVGGDSKGEEQVTQRSGPSSHARIQHMLKPHFVKRAVSRESESSQDENWMLAKNKLGGSVYIHQSLYDNLGITAFKERFVKLEKMAESSHFSLNARDLVCMNASAHASSKAKALVEQFQRFIGLAALSAVSAVFTREFGAVVTLGKNPELLEVKPITDVVLQYVGDRTLNPNKMLVLNSKRREEVFLPLTVDGWHGPFGLHVYPWLSRSEGKFVFSGFEHVATAMCMFGSSLKAIDQNGARFPLIKHNLPLFQGQKIIAIDIDEPSAYEAAQLEDFEKLVCLVDKLSYAEKRPQLHCHLPYYDYILFCFELYIVGRMNQEAFEVVVQSIFEKKEEYVLRMEEVCSKRDIQLHISSPFDNIFGKVEGWEQIIDILYKLVLPTSAEAQVESAEAQEHAFDEAYLVRSYLALLTQNAFHPEHREVWEDFIRTEQKATTTLEELFKMGNAVMVAAVSHNKKPYQVCSLLPLSEKQIQVGYEGWNKVAALKKSYPAVVNLTYLDPFLGYNVTSQGNAFYFQGPQIVSQLMSHGILANARTNAATHVGSESHRPLRTFLQEFAFSAEEGASPLAPTRSL